MFFTIYVNILPFDEILDPAGKAVLGGLKNLEFNNIQEVRVGKRIRLSIEADTAQEAEAIARSAAEKLLANVIMEQFEIEVHPQTALA